ncbi:MAG TPA: quinolinate synthase NadA [Oligoflexia bacterium]|nr:quinolinate synthase NadA [Oligoflexia bacterium]HMR24030.1 quinolinate synthase NadA [Oligoflexia bacterium]
MIELKYFDDIPSKQDIEQTALSSQDLIAEIERLKKEKNALILAHNYQKPEIHDIADKIGDSYGLSKMATEVECDTIVFCGVRFMAETAYILNPEKTVLLPETEAGCGLADEITGPQLKQWKAENPGADAVMYINCSADVKAEADVCCTSSNALHIVENMPSDTILFGPDANLADWVSKSLKAKGSNKKIIPWQGYCPVHKAVSLDMLEKTIELHPDAVIIVHPECNPDVVAKADAVLSTSQMLDFVKDSPEQKFIIGTEIGLIQKAQKICPDKEIHPIYQHKSCDQSCACPYMKVTNLNSVLDSLQHDRFKITVAEDIRLKALKSVEKMLEIGLPKTPKN